MKATNSNGYTIESMYTLYGYTIFSMSSNTTAVLRTLFYVRVSGISKMTAYNRKWIYIYITHLPQTLTWKSIRLVQL